MQEQEANQFALRLLLGDHDSLLEAIRRDARGEYMRFKGAVERVARRASVSPGLLGMIAAYELTEIGEEKDRWGSATNLARVEGPGRPVVQQSLRAHCDFDRLEPDDRTLIDAVVLSE